MNFIQPTIHSMNDSIQQQRAAGHVPVAARSNRLTTAIIVLMMISPLVALAQLPARFYWKSLAGANAVPTIFQSLSGNTNPFDPASSTVSATGTVDANMFLAGYAKVLPIYGRTATFAILETTGRVSGQANLNGRIFEQNSSGYGDPLLEAGINVIGPKAIMNIPDMLRYEPGFSLDVIVDVVFPLGEYNSNQSLNLGQNRWYGRVGTPIVWQLGPWVPGRRTTLELFPSVWFFADNNDLGGKTLSTEPKLQFEGHLTRDLTENFWASLDTTWIKGGESSVNGVPGKPLDTLGFGFTLGYQLSDNLSLTTGYMSTVNDTAPTDLRMDVFRVSLTYGWHKLVQGMNRLKSEE